MRETLRKPVRHAREAALAGLRAVGGLTGLSNSAWRRRQLLILCYHGIALEDEHEWNGLLFVTRDFFRRRLQILRDGGYQVLPLGEAVRSLRSGTLPARSVAITFDDGFHNFHSAAMPVLEEFGVPATNYVSSYYCVNQRPVPVVALRYLLWRASPRLLEAGFLPGLDVAVDLRDTKMREGLAGWLLNRPEVAAGGEEAKQALLAEVAERLGVDLEAILRNRLFHLMTPAEITDAARRGFDMQLHTHRHRTPRDRAAFCHEITENRHLIEEMTGTPTVHFCYPSGDVDMMFLPWLRELGVETGTTTGESGMARATHDPLLLPRFVDTMAQSELMFSAWVSGAGPLLRPGGA